MKAIPGTHIKPANSATHEELVILKTHIELVNPSTHKRVSYSLYLHSFGEFIVSY